MFWMAEVTAIDCMWSKGCSRWWYFIHQYFCTGQGHRSFNIIEGAIELGLGRQVWVDVAGSEKVESGGALGNKAVPEVDRKFGIRAASTSYWVFLPCANGLFCGVIAVIVRQDELLAVVGSLSVWSVESFPMISMCLMKAKCFCSMQAVSS